MRNSSKKRSTKDFVIITGAVGTVIILLTIAALAIVPLAVTFIGGLGGNGGGGTTTNTTTQQQGTIETLQWDIFTDDKYAGGQADCAVAIYDPATNLVVESGETGSDGKWTTSGYFTSDEVFDIKFGNGTFVEYWARGVRVPRFVGTVLSGATHKSTFEVVDQGTFSIAMSYGASRTAISNAGSYNQTTLSSTVTFYFTIRNTEAESGFISSHNPIVDMDCNAVLEIFVNGTNYQYVAWDNNYEPDNNGARQSWYIPIQDEDIVYDLDAEGKELLDGNRVVSADFDFSSVVGDGVDVNARLILGTSISYLDSHTGLPGSSYAYTYTTSVYFNLYD
jgi:hypothetical protein